MLMKKLLGLCHYLFSKMFIKIHKFTCFLASGILPLDETCQHRTFTTIRYENLKVSHNT